MEPPAATSHQRDAIRPSAPLRAPIAALNAIVGSTRSDHNLAVLAGVTSRATACTTPTAGTAVATTAATAASSSRSSRAPG